MLSVLREVSANMDARSGVIHKASFKIVYVAPMKVGGGGGRQRCLSYPGCCAPEHAQRAGWEGGPRAIVPACVRPALGCAPVQ